MQRPSVQTRAANGKNLRHVKHFGGKFSHEDELPLKVSVKRIGWFSRRITVTTLEDVWYQDAITSIHVPAGFTYDLGSIPRVFWLIVSPWDIALESLFHDLLYRKAGTPQAVKRSQADFTLRSMMEDRGKPLAICWMVYLGVRLGGWIGWNERAKANAAASVSEGYEVVDTPSSLAPDKES